jgi:hypothetical protein
VFEHPGGEVTLSVKRLQKAKSLCVEHILRDFPTVTVSTNSFDPVGITTRDEAMGDTYFDDDHRLQGDEVELTVLLNTATRFELSVANMDIRTNISDPYKLHIYEGTLRHHRSPVPLEMAEIQNLLDRTMAIIQAIHAVPGSLTERLVHNAKHDEEPEVRSRNICMLLIHFSDDIDTVHPCLNAILEDNALPTLATENQTLGQSAWMEALNGNSDVAAAAIGALAYASSPQSVPAIRAFTTRPEGDVLHRAAVRAIETIQGRVHG